jgi:HK97 family phage prohead protease
MTKLLTVDEFRSSAKDGAAPAGTVFRFAVTDPEAIADSRKVRFVFSDGTVDRSGDSIDPTGWQTDTFNKNPVALWAHDSSSPPIGRASNVGQMGSKLMGDIEFMSADISPFADSIYRMVTGGYLKAVSVGFIPLDWTFSKDKARPFGIDFTKQELLEISVCPVPCNPNALSDAKSHGIDTGPIREWASKVLDEGGHILIPRAVLEETFRQAKTPRATQQKYLPASATSEWKVCASDELPVADTDAWDSVAAAKRILCDAGFDGESPDAAKAARGFLLSDAANPLLRSSYKMPFADIVNGELVAFKSGIVAAERRFNQTTHTEEILDAAEPIIAKYKAAEITKATDIIAPEIKAGRAISSANAALLQEAMDHHESATKCIKAVLGSASDDPDADGDDDTNDPMDQNDKPVTVITLDARAQRLKEVADLKASLKN